MRVVVVGDPPDRARLRSELERSAIQIVGEFRTLASARAADVEADAIVLAEPQDAGEPVAEPLTPREAEVLALVAEGLSNKAIADELGISDQTVKFHISSIAGKLGASSRTEAVRLAVRRGLLVL